MNSVPAPSRAPASFANLATSAVRSTKPRPDVWIARSDVTMVFALTVEGAVRDIDLGEVMNSVSPSSLRKQGPILRGLSRPVGVGTFHRQPTAAAMGPRFRRDDTLKGI